MDQNTANSLNEFSQRSYENKEIAKKENKNVQLKVNIRCMKHRGITAINVENMNEKEIQYLRAQWGMYAECLRLMLENNMIPCHLCSHVLDMKPTKDDIVRFN